MNPLDIAKVLISGLKQGTSGITGAPQVLFRQAKEFYSLSKKFAKERQNFEAVFNLWKAIAHADKKPSKLTEAQAYYAIVIRPFLVSLAKLSKETGLKVTELAGVKGLPFRARIHVASNILEAGSSVVVNAVRFANPLNTDKVLNLIQTEQRKHPASSTKDIANGLIAKVKGPDKTLAQEIVHLTKLTPEEIKQRRKQIAKNMLKKAASFTPLKDKAALISAFLDSPSLKVEELLHPKNFQQFASKFVEMVNSQKETFGITEKLKTIIDQANPNVVNIVAGGEIRALIERSVRDHATRFTPVPNKKGLFDENAFKIVAEAAAMQAQISKDFNVTLFPPQDYLSKAIETLAGPEKAKLQVAGQNILKLHQEAVEKGLTPTLHEVSKRILAACELPEPTLPLPDMNLPSSPVPPPAPVAKL